MMRLMVLIMVPLLICGSCKQRYDHKGKTPLVEVDGNYFYKEDLITVLPIGLSGEDSVQFAESYIRNWVEDVLFFQKAKSNIPTNTDVNKLVENYRKNLILHLYQQELINQKLPEEIPEEELLDFYGQNKELFKLDNPLIKGLFFKIPLTAPQLGNVRRWYKTVSREAVERLEKYSLQHAVKYEYFYDQWVAVRDILDMMPLEVANPEEYVNRVRQIELKDTAYYYFLNVTDYLAKGDQKPYEFARSQVRDLLINKKQADFIQRMKEDLYLRAKDKNKIIYNYQIHEEIE